ncbi:unnamed protein product, partial [Lymnaea stagnalis]
MAFIAAAAVGINMVCGAVVYIAVLLPNNPKFPFTMMRARPAIDVTFAKLQHMGFFTNDTVKVMYADSRCSSTHAPMEAFNFRYTTKPHIFFGPVCDYALAPVARFCSVWKTPVVSTGGFSHSFLIDKHGN